MMLIATRRKPGHRKSRLRWWVLPLLLLLLPLPCHPAPARPTLVHSLKLQPAIQDGALVLNFLHPDAAPVDFRIQTLEAPTRLVIDFPHSRYSPDNPDPEPLLQEHSGYRRLRWRNRNDGSVRIVLDSKCTNLPGYVAEKRGNTLRLALEKALSETTKGLAPPPSGSKPNTTPEPPLPSGSKPISIDFKGTDIQNVFRFLAEINHLNVVMGDDVSGTVTLRLKEVPWKQVMDIVLRTHQLGMEREGNVLRIAPLEVFQKEEAARQEQLRRQAESSKVKEEVQETVLKILKVNFADIDEVADKIESTVLSDRGTIETDPRTNSLIINDIPDRIEQARVLLAELDEPVHQVMIEAKIVKIEKKSARELGVQWGGAYIQSNSDRYYGISGNNGLGNTGLPPVNDDNSPSLGSSYSVNLPAAGMTSGLGLIFGKISQYNLSVKLSAMQGRGTANILSAPKVLALNQHTARIGQGQEIPYQTTSQDGTTTEFKKAELSLEVTPTITNNGMISMEVVVSKDSKGENTPDGPAINTQTITTSLLLKDGETAVVGGILEKNSSESTQGVPVFSRLPLLGWLFRHDYKDADQTELMIFITPKLIK